MTKSGTPLAKDKDLESLLAEELGGRKEDVNREGKISRRRRCIRACIWMLAFTPLFHVFVMRVVPFLHSQLQQYQDNRDIPIPKDIALGRCANWTHPILGSDGYSAEFYIDTNAPLFVSQGSLSTGGIVVTQSRKVTSTNKAKVTIAVKLDDPKFLEYVQVCEARSKNERAPGSGVGIFSVPWFPRHNGWFSVSVELPRMDSSEDPLDIQSFVSQMPSFSHMFKDVDAVYFNSLSVSTSDRPIYAEALSGGRIDVTTTKAPIRGAFNATNSLSLVNLKSLIDVELGLHDVTPPSSMGPNMDCTGPYWPCPPRAFLRTRKGLIRATVSLTRAFTTIGLGRRDKKVENVLGQELLTSFETSETSEAKTIDTTGGRFLISALNKRGPIDIDFGETPLNHTLRLDAVTSFNHIKVAIPPTYEGSWKMDALKPFRDIVDESQTYKDPTGEHRHRVLWVEPEKRSMQDGVVAWSPSSVNLSERWVRLKSKFGRATLVVV